MIRIATAIALALTLLVCITLARTPAHAADEPQQENTSEEPASTEAPGRTGESETRPANNNRTRQRNGAEVFIPSEEISEDFAVSFPVDI